MEIGNIFCEPKPLSNDGLIFHLSHLSDWSVVFCNVHWEKEKKFSRHGLTCGMLWQFTSPVTSFTQYLYFARCTIQLFVPPPTAELFCPATPCYILLLVMNHSREDGTQGRSRWGVCPPRVTPAYCPPVQPNAPQCCWPARQQQPLSKLSSTSSKPRPRARPPRLPHTATVRRRRRRVDLPSTRPPSHFYYCVTYL